jgi:uncharacterized membrane protein
LKERGWRAGSLLVLPLAGLTLVPATPTTAAAGDGIVRAVLFSSPTCPHCRKVREEILPPLLRRFEGRFQVGVVSTATPAGFELYWAAHRRFAVRQRGVPLLIVGAVALVGSYEIPQRLPDLVAGYLAEGGVGWPDIPGLRELLTPGTASSLPGASSEVTAAVPPGTTPQTLAPTPQPTPIATHPRVPELTPPYPGRAPDSAPAAIASGTPAGLVALGGEAPRRLLDRVLVDPRGNGLAILVLLGMTAVSSCSVVRLRRKALARGASRFDRLNPLLALAGLGVAAYLAHVEVHEVEAVCGPVGDCNAVQHSEYARLFGLVPIGVLGVVGFAAILAAWGVRRWGTGRTAAWAAVALVALTGFGTLFSIYLTFLEPFVIGATCLWCLSSAVIMTTLYWLALPSDAGPRPRRALGLADRARARR